MANKKTTKSSTASKSTTKRTHPAGSKTTSKKKVAKKTSSSEGSKPNPGKFVYYFGKTRTDGSADMKLLLGGKGANLADMTRIGLPVPPGFTITTETCAKYNEGGKRLPHGLMNEAQMTISLLEKETGKVFGDKDNPLLMSVRSGAAVSMPGMMDTILNLGLTDESVEGLARATGNRRFAYDAYRRLINMFGDVVMGVPHETFEHAFDKIKKKFKVKDDTEVPEEGLVQLCEEYKRVYRLGTSQDFPQNPNKQLELAIEAVFKSWDSDKAQSYRRIEGISGLVGTAVNVQTMVFGNMGDDSGTGVAFTRNPSTGENKFYGEFLINAQGEDVVAGIRTPEPVDDMPRWNKRVYDQLLKIKNTLESHYRDMQDIEFTIERGTLYMLQTRTGKRTGAAAVRVACDMVRERLIEEKEAVLRVNADSLTQMLLPSFDVKEKAKASVLTRGLPASPGAAVGYPAFTAEEAVERARKGESVILVRPETSPEDVDGMNSAKGILTSTGGMTSHAAVVARGWGKCCVAGASALHIDAKKGTFEVGGKKFTRKDIISIDGSTGEVISGELKRVEPELSGDFTKLMRWADKYRKIGVRTNADTPADAKRARAFGAEGIGLCRTEHMFFEGPRIRAMRQMILADTRAARVDALEKLLPMQREDFVEIFTAMKGLPVTVRLLDPPLHEFLPHEADAQKELAGLLRMPVAAVKQRVEQLHEMNPMLGHRGCRLSISYPEILEMQVRAIAEACIECANGKVKAMPEIMHPLVGTKQELTILRRETERVIEEVRKEFEYSGRLNIKIGTMIEIPRAALTANEIADVADFFSFGTNDLTQLTFGYSRDDSGSFLPSYLAQDILPQDPFQSLDISGVGQLVEMGLTKGRAVKNELKVGICGEHGGDPASVKFCHRLGMDYVSCSPFRVPIARLAAAQAALEDEKD
ncbi:MAG: pyruvate, phosphate dikinase [Phycisphaeraceae bacterium]|nr:pyruvate, phosphate dikinase [Phycisphaerales bacterium]MCB9860621.1 pyruvate, phosphate dikinase [Phycisphaeraceae bacterium]